MEIFWKEKYSRLVSDADLLTVASLGEQLRTFQGKNSYTRNYFSNGNISKRALRSGHFSADQQVL